MLSFKLSILLALAATGSHASTLRASSRDMLENIAGYTPTTLVTDENAIDQDQRAMETIIVNASAFPLGLKIYNEGGNSGSYAKLTLTAALTAPLPKAGDAVTGVNSAAGEVSGKVLDNYVAGSTTLNVAYAVSDVQVTHVTCKVGGLPTASTITTGCFAPSGNIKINNGANIAYSYAVATDNMNSITLSKLSTTAAQQQKSSTGANFPYFQKYIDYFTSPDYSDKIVQAAFAGTSVTLNGKVFDFVNHPLGARDQMLKKTSAYTTLVMAVIGKMEKAVEYCVAKNDTLAINSLDQAVAFYSGSLEGPDGAGTGYTLHNHADRRCPAFRTCGASGDQVNGTSKVNIDMFKTFNAMKTDLLAKNCANAKTTATKGMPTLLIPQIQGSLRYTRVLATRTNYTGHETAEAEGAAFAAGILAMVNSCNTASATTIWANLKIKAATPPNAAIVQKAFHDVYACLGIKCTDIGGAYNSTSSTYFPGYEPCVDVVAPPTAPTPTAPTTPGAPTAPVAAPTKEPGFFGKIWARIKKFFKGIFGIFS